MVELVPRDPFEDFWRRIRQAFKEFRGFEESDREFGRDFFEEEFEEAPKGPEVSGFHVEIRDTGEGKPEINVERIGEPSAEHTYREKPHIPEVSVEELNKAASPPIKQTLNTNTTKAEKPDEVVLTMQAPGVREGDVTVNQLGQSVEILAKRTDDKAYFAAFELPSDASIDRHKMEIDDGILILTIPRGTA